jgi:hypothetical protein
LRLEIIEKSFEVKFFITTWTRVCHSIHIKVVDSGTGLYTTLSILKFQDLQLTILITEKRFFAGRKSVKSKKMDFYTQISPTQMFSISANWNKRF